MGVNGDKLSLIPVSAGNTHTQKVNYDVNGDGVDETLSYTELGWKSVDTVDRLTKLQDSYDSTGQAMNGNVSGKGGFWRGGHDKLYSYSPENSSTQLNLVFEDYQWVESTYSNGFQLSIDEENGDLVVTTLKDNLSSADDSDGTTGYKTGEVIEKLSTYKNDPTKVVKLVDTSNGLNGSLEGSQTERNVLKDLIKLAALDVSKQESHQSLGGLIGHDDANHNPEVAQSARNFLSNYAKVLVRDGHYDKYKEFLGVMKDAVGYGNTEKIITNGTESLVDFSSQILDKNTTSGNKPQELKNLREIVKHFKDIGAGNAELAKFIDDRLIQIFGKKSDQKESRENFKADLLAGDSDNSAINALMTSLGLKSAPAAGAPALTVGSSALAAGAPASTVGSPASAAGTPAPAAGTPEPDPLALATKISAKINDIQKKLADSSTDPTMIFNLDEAFSILNSDADLPVGNTAIEDLISQFKDGESNLIADSLRGKDVASQKQILKDLINQVNQKYVLEHPNYKTENFDPTMPARELATRSKGLVDFVNGQFINNPYIQRTPAQQQALVADMTRFMTGSQIEGPLEEHFNPETANPDPFLFSDANPDLVQGMWTTALNTQGFNINTIFDGKTTIAKLAEQMVEFNNQYGLPPELVDRTTEESRIGLNTDPQKLAPMLTYLGLTTQQQIDPATQRVITVDVPVTFQVANREVQAKSIPESYDKFLRAVYPDKEPYQVLGDNSLVDNAGNLNKNAFYQLLMNDISKKKSDELVKLKKDFDEMGLGTLLSEKKFYKSYTAQQYESALLRYLQQLDSYRVHFQDNISPTKKDIDPVVLASFGDFYPQYKPKVGKND